MMTGPNRAVRPPHPFQLEPWSSATPPVADEGASADPPNVIPGPTREAPRVMGFLHDLDAATYDLRERVLDAGLLKRPGFMVRLATWVRGRMRACLRLLAPAAKPR
jgi:hypothetical protein